MHSFQTPLGVQQAGWKTVLDQTGFSCKSGQMWPKVAAPKVAKVIVLPQIEFFHNHVAGNPEVGATWADHRDHHLDREKKIGTKSKSKFLKRVQIVKNGRFCQFLEEVHPQKLFLTQNCVQLDFGIFLLFVPFLSDFNWKNNTDPILGHRPRFSIPKSVVKRPEFMTINEQKWILWTTWSPKMPFFCEKVQKNRKKCQKTEEAFCKSAKKTEKGAF